MAKTKKTPETEEKNCSCQGCTNTECTCAGMQTAEERATCDGRNNCSQDGCTFALKHRDEPAAGSTANIVMIPIDKLHPHPDNPRRDVGDISELAESIKANGVLQNLTVVPYVSPVHKRVMNGLYTVIIGHRRLAAAKKAGLKEMPCVVVEMTDKEQVSTMLTENMQRVDLTVYEQAQGFQMMLDMGDSMEVIAEKSGFSKTTVRKRLEIAKLDAPTLKKVSSRQLTLGDFDELAKIDDIETRNKLLASMGTPNFKNELQIALKDQQTTKRMQEWIAVIRTFATEDPEASYQTKQFVKNYSYWRLTEDVVIPEDASTRKYYYKTSKNQIDIYVDRDLTKEAAEKAEREERQRKSEQRRERFEDINQRHYNLRSDFVKGLSNAECKRRFTAVCGLVANVMNTLSNGYSQEMDVEKLAHLLGIIIEDPEMEFDNLTMEWPGLRSAIEAFPEKTLFCMAYCTLDDVGNGYWKRAWDSGAYDYRYEANDELDALYDVLCAFGYEMSDEEKQMQNGDHIVFRTACGEEDVDDEEDLEDCLEAMGDPFEKDVDEA